MSLFPPIIDTHLGHVLKPGLAFFGNTTDNLISISCLVLSWFRTQAERKGPL